MGRTKTLVVGLILGLGFTSAIPTVNADAIKGVPVTGLGSGATQSVPTCNQMEGQVCYNANTGAIGFFIPLSSSKSGVYGVTNVGGGRTAGTTADVGDGTENALTMYLKFAPVIMPVATASLTFTFTDLDLKGWNDPSRFLETVQFFSDEGSPLTPIIRAAGQSGSGPLIFYVTGNSTSQTIFFPDVTSILESPFYIRLNFTSAWNQDGTNTPEFLIATLNTTPLTRVPEPGTLILLIFGIGMAGLMRRGG
jgi:PEP-CTERM motif